ncbi:hypothetical protein XELAEV_18025562mg [Xenopus laevis]|uniref:Uncharacterized protein n=1 Tax=Xenopus laevis TaxID=8355 RepID=A0A974HMG6_XENLA|nr:hypothetical protein XELAEV_18025562mg [Xenopus laevis]
MERDAITSPLGSRRATGIPRSSLPTRYSRLPSPQSKSSKTFSQHPPQASVVPPNIYVDNITQSSKKTSVEEHGSMDINTLPPIGILKDNTPPTNSAESLQEKIFQPAWLRSPVLLRRQNHLISPRIQNSLVTAPRLQTPCRLPSKSKAGSKSKV